MIYVVNSGVLIDVVSRNGLMLLMSVMIGSRYSMFLVLKLLVNVCLVLVLLVIDLICMCRKKISVMVVLVIVLSSIGDVVIWLFWVMMLIFMLMNSVIVMSVLVVRL